MKNLRRSFNLFCMKHRNGGIPNLMLYIALGAGIVNIMSQVMASNFLYALLCFDRTLILRGQVWRLFTYPLTYSAGTLLLTGVALLCYYSLGRTIESLWGSCKFTIFYVTGVVLMDLYCLIFGGRADAFALNLSLFLSYATLFPDAQFLLFFIIPVRAWIFGLFHLILVAYQLLSYPFPYNFFSVISLANYFLFFGPEVLNLLPRNWQRKLRRKPSQPKVVYYKAAPNDQAKNYTHKCTVCGRTDATNPELEFRYCSRCKGYYCYCQDHIGNHSHVE